MLNVKCKMDKGKNIGGDTVQGCEIADCSSVRVMLCDTNPESCREVFSLLRKYSYQVTVVGSASEMTDELNSKGARTDIILAEIDLLLRNNAKIMKYIMLDKGLKIVPIIMLLTRDKIPLIKKGLKLGAIDYLVKPLRSRDLSSLWSHSLRRKQMLEAAAMPQESMMDYNLDLMASISGDHCSNVHNGTALFWVENKHEESVFDEAHQYCHISHENVSMVDSDEVIIEECCSKLETINLFSK